jgi:hypothetical protein
VFIIYQTVCILPSAHWQFAFDAYDVEGSGRLIKEDFTRMCLELSANEPRFSKMLVKVLNKFDGSVPLGSCPSWGWRDMTSWVAAVAISRQALDCRSSSFHVCVPCTRSDFGGLGFNDFRKMHRT